MSRGTRLHCKQDILERRLAHGPRTLQMLQMLKQETNLVALLQHNAVWLPADPRTVWVLDMCCKGQLEGGPAMGQQIASTLGLVLPPPPAQPQPQVRHTQAGATLEHTTHPDRHTKDTKVRACHVLAGTSYHIRRTSAQRRTK